MNRTLLMSVLISLVALGVPFTACDGASGGADPGGTGGDGSTTGGNGGTGTGGTTGGDTGSGGDGGDKPSGGVPGGGTTSGGGPPELSRIGDRIVALGETLVVVVEASDPDGDDLNYSVYGQLPAGAKFVKKDRRFEWTPTELVSTVFLTFVVSDGNEFDRETVRIEVVAEKGTHPPEFSIVGDQNVVVGEVYELQLEATDPDGDTLTFGHTGLLPINGELQPTTGRFTWTPSEESLGVPVRIVFTVSDGALQSEMEIDFVVQETAGGGGGGAAPLFTQVQPQVATVGQALTFQLAATDPNGDGLTFGIYAGSPPEGTLVGDLFSWTPTAGQANLAYSVTFSASDGTYTTYMTVDLSVASLTDGTCTDDPWEPSETLVDAHPVQSGSFTASICDTELSPIDVDVFSIEVPQGWTLEMEIAFDPWSGDLDLYVVDAAGEILTASETSDSVEAITWLAPTTSIVYPVVAGFGQPSFAQTYSMTIELVEDSPLGCAPDVYEPNDSVAQALDLGTAKADLSLCAGDTDVWRIPLLCGESLSVTMETWGSGDLDMGLWKDEALAGAPLAQAATASIVETLTLDAASEAANYWLKVVGYPPNQAFGTYALTAVYAGGCFDDILLGNDSVANAEPLPEGDGDLNNLQVCCSSDWFSMSLTAGSQVLAEVKVDGLGSASLAAYGPDGFTQLAADGPSGTSALVDITAQTTGVHYLRVNGTVGTTYDIEWVRFGETTTGCTATSCAKYSVCDSAAAACVSDFCNTTSDCPSGHQCIETYCVNPCEYDWDCRTEQGYACKSFQDGQFCGIEGIGSPGDSCASHTACSGDAACIYLEQDGYCAALGCDAFEVSCPIFTSCAHTPWGLDFCGKTCNSDGDCREDDGYECSSEGVCSIK